MKTTTIRQLILQRLREKWKNGSTAYYYHQDIEDKLHAETHYKKDKKTGKDIPFHYTHGYIGREARKLCEDNLIERNPDEKNTYYRYKPTSHELSSQYMKIKYLL